MIADFCSGCCSLRRNCRSAELLAFPAEPGKEILKNISQEIRERDSARDKKLCENVWARFGNI